MMRSQPDGGRSHARPSIRSRRAGGRPDTPANRLLSKKRANDRKKWLETKGDLALLER